MLMRKESNNFLARMEPQQFTLFRKLVVTNILATDMKEHFECQNKFEAFCNEIKDKKQEFGTPLSPLSLSPSYTPQRAPRATESCSAMWCCTAVTSLAT